MLIYRNSIDPETKASPALIVFGRPIRDPIPIPMGRYCPHPTWTETLINREKALAKRHSREHEKWREHTRSLLLLRIGDHVYLQNLIGNHPKRWERTGTIVEVRQFHQYVVKIDGSGRLTLRNRQHLRKFTPFKAASHEDIIESLSPIIRDAVIHSNGLGKPTINVPARNPESASGEEDKCLGAPASPGPSPERAVDTATPTAGDPAHTAESTHIGLPMQNVDATHTASPQLHIPAIHTTPKKPPMALRRLASHNAPGIAETQPGNRSRSRRSQH